MKNLFILFSLFTSGLFAQTTTDSIATSLGEFVLVSSDTIEPSTGYLDETSTTSDGGTAQYLEISSGARYAAPVNENTNMLVEMQPNPASGIVELNISGGSGAVMITVTDLLGQAMYSTTLNVDERRTTYLPTQTWASSTYIVTVSGGGNLFAERLVVR